jgi:hypothetical protein
MSSVLNSSDSDADDGGHDEVGVKDQRCARAQQDEGTSRNRSENDARVVRNTTQVARLN